MDVLEHPLEAAAFRVYSFPDASAATGAAAWTCLAAFLAAAAAAGLWRLRCGSSSAPADPAAGAVLNPLELQPSKAKEVITTDTARWSSSSSDSAASPKERYTAYYRDSARVGCCGVDYDDEGGDDEDDEEEEEEAPEEGEADGGLLYHTPGPFGWDVVVRSLPLSPTGGEMAGRYRSPTAALSGSVVRLWDEAVVDAGVTASPRRRRRVVGTVSAF